MRRKERRIYGERLRYGRAVYNILLWTMHIWGWFLFLSMLLCVNKNGFAMQGQR